MNCGFNGWKDQCFNVVEVNGVEFKIKHFYKDLNFIGIGAQGVVCSCFDAVHERKVAIKKLIKPTRSPMDAKRALREIRILKKAAHKNIVKLVEIFTTEIVNYIDIYIVTELMESTLDQIVTMKLDHPRLSYLLYQLLCGVFYLHRCGVLHRDLKPNNVAVNSDCTLRILDFGLSRSPNKSHMMTPYVMTRYYRAPEVILGGIYGSAADMWSIGCIFGEMIKHQILFEGNDYVDQWHIINRTLGGPGDDFISSLSQPIKTYLNNQPIEPGYPFDQIFKDSDFEMDLDNTDLTGKDN
ncbi:hypothetical protein ACOME3_000058 [Neoechinorhynchus agilis]